MNIFNRGKKVNSNDNAVDEKADKKKTSEKVKDYAKGKFIESVEKEKAISKKLAFWSIVYEIVMMLIYTAMTIITVLTKWADSKHPTLILIVLIIYVLMFFVMTAYYLSGNKNDGRSYDNKKAIIQNYKSVSVIIKKVLKIVSVVLSILITLESWQDGLIFQIIGIVLIVSSVFALIKAIISIKKEVGKMSKSLDEPKESKFKKAKHKIEAYSDSLKEDKK